MTYDRRGDDDRRQAEERRQEVLVQYIADIASRLRPACAHLTEEEFDRLVTDIAHMKVKFDEIDTQPGALRPLRGPHRWKKDE